MSNIIDSIKNFKLVNTDVSSRYIGEVNLASRKQVIHGNELPEEKATVILKRDKENFAEKFSLQRDRYQVKSNARRLDSALEYFSTLDAVKSSVAVASQELSAIRDVLRNTDFVNLGI